MTLLLAVRNVFRHRTRSLITLAAIAIGGASVIFVGGFFENMFFKMRESYIKGHTGHIQVYRAGFLEKGSSRPFDYLIENPQEIVPLIREIPGVIRVTQRLQFSGMISTGDNTVSCLVQGVEPLYEPSIRQSDAQNPREDLAEVGGAVIEAGDPLDEGHPYGTILGRGLAAGLDAKVGDALVLVANTVSGAINAFDISVQGIFFTSAKVFDDHVLRMPLDTAQQLLYTNAVQTLVIMLERTEDTPRITRQLQARFRERGLPLEVKTWEEINDFYTKTRELFDRMYVILKFVIALIVILSIYNTMTMAVMERTNEIGTMMALGTKRSGVLRLFIVEGVVLGVIGGMLGVLLGSAVTSIVGSIGITMPPAPGSSITWLSKPMVVPSVLAFAFLLSLVTAVVSSAYPAYRASRLEIAEALRHV